MTRIKKDIYFNLDKKKDFESYLFCVNNSGYQHLLKWFMRNYDLFSLYLAFGKKEFLDLFDRKEFLEKMKELNDLITIYRLKLIRINKKQLNSNSNENLDSNEVVLRFNKDDLIDYDNKNPLDNIDIIKLGDMLKSEGYIDDNIEIDTDFLKESIIKSSKKRKSGNEFKILKKALKKQGINIKENDFNQEEI